VTTRYNYLLSIGICATGQFISESAVKGGYPELYEKPEIDPHFWYGAYFSTYLERDVRNILNVGNLRDFDRFLRAVAVRTGQILSYSDLARDVGIAPNTFIWRCLISLAMAALTGPPSSNRACGYSAHIKRTGPMECR